MFWGHGPASYPGGYFKSIVLINIVVILKIAGISIYRFVYITGIISKIKKYLLSE